MATEDIGEVIKGEGPLQTEDGIVLPFEYKKGVFSSETHQLALSNQELDNLAVRSITAPGFVGSTRLNMPGVVYIEAAHLISDGGALDMVGTISSVTENPFTGIVFNASGKFSRDWKLQSVDLVPDITLLGWKADLMASDILKRHAELKQISIKEAEKDLARRSGIPDTLDIYS